LIALGLYFSAREMVAIHKDAHMPRYRIDTDALAPIRIDMWRAWAHRPGGGDAHLRAAEWTPRTPSAPQADVDTPSAHALPAGDVSLVGDAAFVVHVSRLRPHTAVRGAGIR
jgi:hypothetical protein